MAGAATPRVNAATAILNVVFMKAPFVKSGSQKSVFCEIFVPKPRENFKQKLLQNGKTPVLLINYTRMAIGFLHWKRS
jgi:hypothetical protein